MAGSGPSPNLWQRLQGQPRTIWCIRGTLNYVCLAATVRLLAVEICDKTDIDISLIRLDVYDV